MSGHFKARRADRWVNRIWLSEKVEEEEEEEEKDEDDDDEK